MFSQSEKTLEQYTLHATYITYIIWFAVREHFSQNICDLICENGLLIKLLKQQFCIHPVPIYVQLFIIIVCIQNCFLKCFNSGPFSKIISNILSIINLSVSTMIYIVFQELQNKFY